MSLLPQISLHSLKVSKLFSLPSHPPYWKRLHFSRLTSQKNLYSNDWIFVVKKRRLICNIFTNLKKNSKNLTARFIRVFQQNFGLLVISSLQISCYIFISAIESIDMIYFDPTTDLTASNNKFRGLSLTFTDKDKSLIGLFINASPKIKWNKILFYNRGTGKNLAIENWKTHLKIDWSIRR